MIFVKLWVWRLCGIVDYILTIIAPEAAARITDKD